MANLYRLVTGLRYLLCSSYYAPVWSSVFVALRTKGKTLKELKPPYLTLKELKALKAPLI